MFHLWQVPKAELFLDEVEAKVKFLEHLKIFIFVQQFCMKLVELISTQIQSFQLSDLTHGLKEQLRIDKGRIGCKLV